jgi:hypothetical protein
MKHSLKRVGRFTANSRVEISMAMQEVIEQLTRRCREPLVVALDWVEEMFHDQKSRRNGFALRNTRIRNANRFDRLLLPAWRTSCPSASVTTPGYAITSRTGAVIPAAASAARSPLAAACRTGSKSTTARQLPSFTKPPNSTCQTGDKSGGLGLAFRPSCGKIADSLAMQGSRSCVHGVAVYIERASA